MFELGGVFQQEIDRIYTLEAEFYEGMVDGIKKAIDLMRQGKSADDIENLLSSGSFKGKKIPFA